MTQDLLVVKDADKYGYIDENGTAWLNAEFVARGLGFTQTKNGVEYVRWKRINGYLEEFGFLAEVHSGDLVPESVLYSLAMKVNNKVAKAFQSKIATEILPTLRKNALLRQILGNPLALAEMLGVTDLEPDKKCVYVVEMDKNHVKIGVTQDCDRRIKEVMNNSGMEVTNLFHTEPMNRQDAFAIERACHKKFDNVRKRGEFFNVDFDKACEELQHQTLPVRERQEPMDELF